MRVHVRPAPTWHNGHPGGPQPLVAVGRDCDCGNPLVWFGTSQICAVYGSHPAITPTKQAMPIRFVARHPLREAV